MGTEPTTYQPLRSCGPTTGNMVITPVPAPVATTAPNDPLTARSLRIWEAGDYDRISAGFREEAAAFVARQQLTPGDEVLDAACGSGNLTIPAARTGASVTGLDLVPSLLDAAADWAEAERLSLRLDQGNVEELPYANAAFDVVLSMFGIMFAARPERVVSELARVTRAGGRVALANWTREGFIGQMFAIHGAHLKPPAGIPSPLQWGDEAWIRSQFPEGDWQVATTRRMLTFRYPHSASGTAKLFMELYGPTVRTLEALDEAGRQSFADQLTAHWNQHQQASGNATEVESEYLDVVAIRL